MQLARVVETSNEVSATDARSEKVSLLAALLADVSAEEAAAAVSFLSGSPLQSRLGAGYAAVYAVDVRPAELATLSLSDVDQALERLARVAGQGSKQRRHEILTELFAKATEGEQEFLRGLILRNLRQGALEGVMAEAVARVLDVSVERVRRAAMLEGDLVDVSARAITEGELAGSNLALFTPVQPMLAKTAGTAGDAVAELGRAVVEAKLDGLRLQVHRSGDEVAIYTRNLREVTGEMPGVAAQARSFPAASFILDGEGLTVDETGAPRSFQDSMSKGQGEWSLSSFYFDILHLDGHDLVDEPLSVRRDALMRILPASCVVDSIVTSDPAEADSFFADAIATGFEGVVVKDPGLPYEAGRRGTGWLKVKPVHTLDLVILGAEWGSGRRQGWLSNLHLGALGPAGDFVMLGKTFKGLTDEMLAWQTKRFLELESHRLGRVVFIEPEIVYEIAFDGVQRSTRYPGGVTLRFARVRGYREDKTPQEADTLETVRGFLT